MPPRKPASLLFERRRTVTRQQTVSEIPPQKACQAPAALGLPSVHTLMRKKSRFPAGIPADENPVPQSHSNRLTPIKIPPCRQPLHPAEPGKGNFIDHKNAHTLWTSHPATPRHRQLGRTEGATAPHSTTLHPPGPDGHPRKARQHRSLYQNPAHSFNFLPLTSCHAIGEILPTFPGASLHPSGLRA